MAVSLTNFLDSGCIVASSLALTAWAAAFNFGSAWTAILGAIGANAFGAAIGALIGGFLTDKFGRTTIYKYNLLVYAAGVFIAMVAVNLPMVVVGVVLSGLSVGAGVPASWSYISETSTSTKRASNIGISQFAWSCGPAIIFILSLVMSFIIPGFESDGTTLLPAGTYGPFDGMLATRLLFLVLLIVALIAWNLQRQLQESADWAEKNASATEKQSFGKMMATALKNPVNVKTIIFLVAVYLTWNLAAGTNGQFMPYLYAAAGNIDGATVLGCYCRIRPCYPERRYRIHGLGSLGIRNLVGHFRRFLRSVLLRSVGYRAVPHTVSRRRSGHHVLLGSWRFGHLVARGRWRHHGRHFHEPCRLLPCSCHYVRRSSYFPGCGRYLVPQDPGQDARPDHRRALRQDRVAFHRGNAAHFA